MQKIKANAQVFDVYFASDFHLDHDKEFLYGPRGFNSAEENKNKILSDIDKLFPTDIVFYLGDFSLNSDVERTLSYLERFPCRVYYIWGNHESFAKRIYKQAVGDILGDDSRELYPTSILDGKVTFLGDEAELTIGKNLINLHHMAPRLWDKINWGSWALCGHSHGNCAEINPAAKREKILDVGVENALKHNGTVFFSYQEVAEIMSTKTLVTKDHH